MKQPKLSTNNFLGKLIKIMMPILRVLSIISILFVGLIYPLLAIYQMLQGNFFVGVMLLILAVVMVSLFLIPQYFALDYTNKYAFKKEK